MAKFYLMCYQIGIWDYFHYRDREPDWMVDSVEVQNWKDGYKHAKSLDIKGN